MDTTSSSPLIPVSLSSGESKSTYRQELYWLLKNALPLVISYLLQNSLQSVSVISAGHLGSTELAAASLASMFVTVTGLSTVMGTTLCLDTLCSQAYTSRDCDKRVVGLHVQRCLVFLSLLFIPIMTLWWYAQEVFLLLRQDPDVAYLSGRFVQWMILALPAFALFESLKKMLQAQGLFRAPTYVLFVGAPFNVLASYTLVWHTSLGFIGAPIAAVLTYWLLVLLLVVYIIHVDGSQVWPKWQWYRTHRVGGVLDRHAYGPMLKLAVPGILLICSENWAYEIIALASSWIDTSGTTSQGAQSVIITSVAMLYTIPFGVGISAANRVGNALGAQRPKQAAMASKVALAAACVVASINASMLVFFRHQWGYLFTDDEDVVMAVSKVLPIVAVFIFGDNMAGIADGILNGQGRQHVGAWFNLAAYYLSSLPLGFYLCFSIGLGLAGIWIGLMISLLAVAIATMFVVWRSDWPQQAEIARLRATPPQYTGLPVHSSQQQGGDYPGNQGGSTMGRDALVYDPTTGQPMLSSLTVQRHQIETSLGPVCPQDRGYHSLRMHYTTKSLLFAILIIPYCCGYRGRRVCQCTKCNQKFPSIILPEP
ncbi:mate-domain-containing protein [Halteromyces radiatus]|uniref:mate-domain-containing protein n=1 Tax=Halteromyces radiatus TaxID=101107 RepID=UPI00221E872D|nr:mate-domain-containing protein [Halteromyces radiatus]KAI8089358.1 mate-domain-containing protein [Halteromyces radiatus]